MTRIIAALLLMLSVLTSLSVPALADPIDQARWTERKRHVRLPNGIRLAYVEMGDPNGTPVLLLHGVTDSSRTWTILAPYLERHRLLILDQRGHGGSDAPRCCYAPANFVEDAVLFLDAMRVRRAAVVGHSLGSMVGQQLAAEHPDRVSRLVLIGSTALAPVSRESPMWQAFMSLREPVSSNTEFLRQWSLAASPTPVDPNLVRYTDPEAAAVPLHVWRDVIRELLNLPAGRHAPEVRVPVLILSAGRDELFPAEHHRSLVQAYSQAQAHVFPDLGHNLIVERPEHVSPLLVRFLAPRQLQE